MLDAVPSLIAYIDKDGYYREVNAAYAAWAQLPPAEITGKHLADILGPEVLMEIEQYVAAALRGEKVEIEMIIQHTGRYVEATYVPHFEPAGHVAGFVAVITDITEKKKIEEALAASRADMGRFLSDLQQKEERLRMAVDSTSLGTWDFNAITGELNWSDQCKKIYGLAPDREVNYEMFSDHIFPADRQRAEEAILRAQDPAGDGRYNIEYRILKFDDREVRWIRVRGKVFFKDETADRFIGTVVDITDEKRREELEMEGLNQLRRNEELFRTVADTAPVMIWMTDTEQRCTFLNRSALDFTGRTMEEEYGLGWMDGIHPEDREQFRKNYDEAVKARRRFYLEYRILRHDSEYRWVYDAGVPRYGQDGAFEGYIGSSMDIENQKMLAGALEKEVEKRTRDLKEANIQLERSNEELEQYAYVASHDLQEPLRKIRIFAGRIAEKDRLDTTSQAYFDKIVSAAIRMETLINDVLDYSRLTHLETQFVPTKLDDILHSTLEDFDLLIAEKKARITSSPLPEVPALPLQMRQLFHNLIGNSLKFCREDQPCEISIRYRMVPVKEVAPRGLLEGRSYGELIFSDNGIGFNPGFAEQIFVIFQRLNGRQQFSGTGIGLALCRKIMNIHGGSVYAESSEGQGARFHVILPLTR